MPWRGQVHEPAVWKRLALSKREWLLQVPHTRRTTLCRSWAVTTNLRCARYWDLDSNLMCEDHYTQQVQCHSFLPSGTRCESTENINRCGFCPSHDSPAENKFLGGSDTLKSSEDSNSKLEDAQEIQVKQETAANACIKQEITTDHFKEETTSVSVGHGCMIALMQTADWRCRLLKTKSSCPIDHTSQFFQYFGRRVPSFVDSLQHVRVHVPEALYVSRTTRAR